MAEPIKLLKAQAELYYGKKPAGKKSDYRGIYCGRAGGKSYILSLMSAQGMLMGKNIMIFAQDYECLQKNLIQPITEFLDAWNVKYRLIGGAHNNIDVTNLRGGTSHCYGFTYENYKKARGRTKVAIQVYDELAQAPADIFVATAACSRDCGFDPMTLFGSTPLKGTYWDKWVNELIKDGYPIVTHGGIYENDHVTEAEIEQMERAFKGMDEQFIRQELYGEIIDGDTKFMVFTNDCFGRKFTTGFGFRSLGIDCAGMGRDYNVFYVVDDRHVLEKRKVQKANTFEMNAIARELIHKYDVKQVNIDMTGGFGQGLYDMLYVMADSGVIELNGINFGQAAKDREHYINARAEMYFTTAKACREEFCFPDDDEELREQCRSQQFETAGTGKTKLIDKEVIKGMIGASPDCSDAFCLAHYLRKRYSGSASGKDALYEDGIGW